MTTKSRNRSAYVALNLAFLACMTVTLLSTSGCATPNLLDASKKGDEDKINASLAHGSDINAADEQGWTALHMAAYEGHKKTTELLCSKGANVNARTVSGWTPLHMAASRGHAFVAQRLLAHGADVSARTNEAADGTRSTIAARFRARS